jgi:hypothetical protein
MEGHKLYICPSYTLSKYIYKQIYIIYIHTYVHINMYMNVIHRDSEI